MGELGRARKYFTKAFELREHASEREKLLITAAYYANVTEEQDKAAQTYRETLAAYPRDDSAYGNLGLAYVAQADYQAAMGAMRQQLQLTPDHLSLYEDLANSFVGLAAPR